MKPPLLLKLEIRKLFGNRFHLCIMILFIIAKISLGFLAVSVPANVIYRMYMENLSGPLTPEKEAYILQEKEQIESILSQRDQMDQDYREGILSKDDYRIYNLQYYEAQEKQETFLRVFEKYQYFTEREDIKIGLQAQLAEAEGKKDAGNVTRLHILLEQYHTLPEFFDDTGWNILLGLDIVDIVYIMLFILIVSYFNAEYSCCIQPLNDTYKLRSRLYLYKTEIVLITTLVFVLLSQSVDFLFANATYGLPNAQAPMQSLSQFGSYAHAISLRQSAICILLMRILGCVCFGLGLTVAAVKIKKVIPITALFVFFMFPAFLGVDMLPPMVTNLLFPAILSGTAIFASYQLYNVLSLSIPSSLATLVFYGILLVLFLYLMMRVIRSRTGEWRQSRGETSTP